MAFSSLFLSIIAITFSGMVHVLGLDSTIDFPSTNSSLSWTNTKSSFTAAYEFPRKVIFRAVLQTGASSELYGIYNESISFAFGFYCNFGQVDPYCLLSVVMLDSSNGTPRLDESPEVVWAANSNRPVGENATLIAEPGRGLVLVDSDGTEAWSTEIGNDTLVTSMLLGGNGDLVLSSSKGLNLSLWRSFYYPTDTLVIGQELLQKQALLSRTSDLVFSAGRFSLSLSTSALTASTEYEGRSLTYLDFTPGRDIPDNSTLQTVTYYGNNISFTFRRGSKSFSLYLDTNQASPIGILRLDWDGCVVYHAWDSTTGWSKEKKTLTGYDKCLTPLVCGEYGVCTKRGCACPETSDRSKYFEPTKANLPNGCSFINAVKPISTLMEYQLVDFGNLSYFSYADQAAATAGLNELGKCRQACEGNSSCRAAFFEYQSNPSDGGLCYLTTEVLTIRGPDISQGLNTIASIKVPATQASQPLAPTTPAIARDHYKTTLIRSTIGKAIAISLPVAIFSIISLLIFYKIRQVKRKGKDCFDVALGAPTRFSYKELCAATGKFSTRLGRGGFGSVFKGELKDGTVIAVKRLDSIEQGMGEFLAEMKTMGCIHHYNLVKLIGFCADESNRLLVYEYMSNGSLDKWIFNCNAKQTLTWESTRRIILGVARGLAYLHEECNQRIVHLDMKPHNILLDESYNAKISDFGLARFIDRNQSQVVTAMRGTLGYLAPEWQSSRITVKADIYSFGIVILEAVSGRMNLDYTQDDSNVHLLRLVQRKADKDRLIDIANKKMVDWESHEEDIVNMIRIAAWCLNEDQAKRPSMSTVVKALEGTVEVEKDIDFKFAHVLILSCSSPAECSSKPVSSELL